MKGIHIFCASQASTAISQITMDKKQPSSPSSSPSSSSSTILFAASPPSTVTIRSSQIPEESSLRPLILRHLSTKPHKNHRNQKKKKKTKKNQKIIIENGDRGSTKTPDDDDENSIKIVSTNSNAFISPPGSTRYLLSERVLFNSLSDLDRPVLKLFPAENSESEAVKTNGSCDEKPPSSVVVLRVSLHCRGCERKMRKHISRMEGVTSFNIDFAAKKVTVTGNITPLEVLSSISKVKNAQLWPPTISSSTPPPLNLTNSDFKNDYNGVST
ncbi:hypothetical protein DH2020_025910 [Rehmannia glutinosa]|uniref:HMA domain-containing protein n=1 Tax=Rehmannia glutinosa TaxID=99300 RepID=A0ABR0VYE8_REHGL